MVKLDKRQGLWECDVHAERSKFNWERLRTVGLLSLLSGLGSAGMQRWDIARPALLIGLLSRRSGSSAASLLAVNTFGSSVKTCVALLTEITL